MKTRIKKVLNLLFSPHYLHGIIFLLNCCAVAFLIIGLTLMGEDLNARSNDNFNIKVLSYEEQKANLAKNASNNPIQYSDTRVSQNATGSNDQSTQQQNSKQASQNSAGLSGLPLSEAANQGDDHSDSVNNLENDVVNLKEYQIKISSTNIDPIYPREATSFCISINKNLYNKNYRCKINYNKSSLENLIALKRAETDFVLVQSDWQKDIMTGTDGFNRKENYDKLRFVFSLQNEPLVLAVRANSEMKHLDDIRGKIVNVGNLGSATRAMFDSILSAKGWRYERSFKSITHLSPEEQIYALCRGQIDVMSIVSASPNDIVKKVTRMCQVRILDVLDNDMVRFIEQNSDYHRSKISGGLYLGNPFDVDTIATKTTVVTSADVSTENVYLFVREVMKELDGLRQIHPSLEDLDEDEMFQEGAIAPLHAGVTKYLQERNMNSQNSADNDPIQENE